MLVGEVTHPPDHGSDSSCKTSQYSHVGFCYNRGRLYYCRCIQYCLIQRESVRLSSFRRPSSNETLLAVAQEFNLPMTAVIPLNHAHDPFIVTDSAFRLRWFNTPT